MASLSTWKVGTVTVPSSTGSVAYSPTGWGGKTPKAMVFFGTNFLTEDVAVTTNGMGVFRGLCAPQWDSPGTLTQVASCVVSTPSGNAHSTQNNAIRMLDTAGAAATLYVANVTAFSAGGFTLNWTAVTAGGYKVVYVALFDVDNSAARAGSFAGATNALGWKAGACLTHGCWAGPIDGTNRTQEFYGGAAFRGSVAASWQSASATILCFPTSQSGQYLNEINNFTPNTVLMVGGHFTGPFLISSNLKVLPTGGGLTSFTMLGDSADYGIAALWDDEDNATGRNTPATSQGCTTTKSGLPFAPGLVLFYGISNEPSGQGSGSRGAVGFGVVTPDFQWCATIDGKSSQGAFQSFQRGFADVVNGTLIHAGTVALTADGFVMTTEEDDVSSVNMVWHAFGHPETAPWIPQIYRWVMPT
jgi:hypothetical protein